MDISLRLENKLGYLFEHLSGIWSRQSDQVLQEKLGLGLAQYKVMMALAWNPKARQRTLAQILGQTEASISRQIKLLQEKGLVVVKINPSERREHITEITTKGLRMAEAARAAMAQFHQPMFERLNDKQRRQLLDIMIVLHDYTCESGKSHACGRPLGL